MVKLALQGSPVDFYHPFSVRFQERWKKSPLHLGCQIGNLAIVRYLLDSGADPARQIPNDITQTNTTPMSLAVKGRHVEVFYELASRFPQLSNSHYHFCAALESGIEEATEPFFQAGVSIHAVAPENHLVPLHSAIIGDNVALVKRLIDLMADIQAIKDPVGIGNLFRRTWPMHVLAQHGRNINSAVLAELLLSYGAKVSYPRDIDEISLSHSVLEWAVLSNNVPLVDVLLRHIPLNRNLSSLGYARSLPMIQLLLRRGADLY